MVLKPATRVLIILLCWVAAIPCSAGPDTTLTRCGTEEPPCESNPPMGYEIKKCSSVKTQCRDPSDQSPPVKVRRYCEMKPPSPDNIPLGCAGCFAWELLASLSISNRFAGDFGQWHAPVKDGGEGPTIWERWPTVDEVFEPGKIPCELGSDDPPEVLSIKNALSEYLFGHHSLLHIECMVGTVVDQEGERVWLEVQVNPVLERQIVDSGWPETIPGMGFSQFESFVKGVNLRKYSMTFRTAWVPVGAKDREAFYVRKKWLYHEDKKRCEGPVEMVLVGINIWLKTEIHGDILWISFEHARNTPTHYSDSGKTSISESESKEGWSFYTSSPPPGTHSNELDRREPPTVPTQVVRGLTPDSRTQEANDHWHELLKDTVWKNYLLIGAQWGRGVDKDGGLKKPEGEAKLASSVLETACQVGAAFPGYTCEKSPNSSENLSPMQAGSSAADGGESLAYHGCLSCHGCPGIPTADTSFLLHRARSNGEKNEEKAIDEKLDR